MSLTQTKTVDGIKYKDIEKSKKPVDGKQVAIKMAERLSTLSLVWILVKRHKVGILAIGNIILVMNYALPEWPSILRSLI